MSNLKHCNTCTCETNETNETKLKVNNVKTIVKMMKLETNSMCLVISGRNSGKSFLIQDLVYEMLKRRKYELVYLFSQTAQLSIVDNSYGFVPKQFIFRTTEDITTAMTQIINSQMIRFDKKLKAISILCIFDDIEISGNGTLNALAVRGRHYGITVILSSQKASTLISNTIRSNFDYLFFRKMNEDDLKEYIYPMLMNIKTDKKHLLSIAYENTKNHQFIFYDNKRDDDNNELYVLKAVERKFKFNIKGLDDNSKQKQK